MIRFGHIEYLWGLALIPVFILLFIRISQWKKKAMVALGDKSVVTLMIPHVSFSRPWIKFILFSLAFAFLVIGVADPQIGSKWKTKNEKGPI